jgi:hypothetical protein
VLVAELSASTAICCWAYAHEAGFTLVRVQLADRETIMDALEASLKLRTTRQSAGREGDVGTSSARPSKALDYWSERTTTWTW